MSVALGPLEPFFKPIAVFHQIKEVMGAPIIYEAPVSSRKVTKRTQTSVLIVTNPEEDEQIKEVSRAHA